MGEEAKAIDEVRVEGANNEHVPTDGEARAVEKIAGDA